MIDIYHCVLIFLKMEKTTRVIPVRLRYTFNRVRFNILDIKYEARDMQLPGSVRETILLYSCTILTRR